MSVPAISPIDLIVAPTLDRMAQPAPAASAARPVSFTGMLLHGIDAANAKVAEADRMVQAAAVDSSLPLHRVTYALEEARISLELMIQLRNRLVDAAQQIMNMQV